MANGFDADRDTVALFRFGAASGTQVHDTCGDRQLTLHSKVPLWVHDPERGCVARFTRRKDDANLFVGPVGNDKLHLKTCEEAWAIEAHVRYTGPVGEDLGNTFAAICTTDDEGFSLPGGIRGGWTLGLVTSDSADGLIPWGRFIGSRLRPTSNICTAAMITPTGPPSVPVAIIDQSWHHVCWQFRHEDQLHGMFLDGRLIWKCAHPGGSSIVNDVAGTCIPFCVGGMLHSQDPPFYLDYGNFEGEISEIRISSTMRYPMSDSLKVICRDLPDAPLHGDYAAQLHADGARGPVAWQVTEGGLPDGLTLDAESGLVCGQARLLGDPARFSVTATDGAQSDAQHFEMEVKAAQLLEESLPLAFAGEPYACQLTTRYVVTPVDHEISSGNLPEGVSLSRTGRLTGLVPLGWLGRFEVRATDAAGQSLTRGFALRGVPPALKQLGVDEHTVALYDWQGASGKMIPDRCGDERLTLTWVNMTGDQRIEGSDGKVYPRFPGGGEYGFASEGNRDKLDLKTCTEAWTVEAWVRPGGRTNHYGQPFAFGHICGTYDNSRRGIWELYLAHDGCEDGGWAPGVHFFDQQGDTSWMDLHPWRRREGSVLERGPNGRVADPHLEGIRDTQWHHVAWQYAYQTDVHELFLDGTLIWKLQVPAPRQLRNNRVHDAQFSVGSRLQGYAQYGGGFNWLGYGNFYGQIGDIRLSDVRRYGSGMPC